MNNKVVRWTVVVVVAMFGIKVVGSLVDETPAVSQVAERPIR